MSERDGEPSGEPPLELSLGDADPAPALPHFVEPAETPAPPPAQTPLPPPMPALPPTAPAAEFETHGDPVVASVAATEPEPFSWRQILTTPLRGGVIFGTVLLALLCAAISARDGGAVKDDRQLNAWVQAAFLLPAVFILGMCARRITFATIHGREITAGSDDLDPVSIPTAAGHFVVVLAICLAPLFLWMSVNAAAQFPRWVTMLAMFVCFGGATLHFPFAHAAVVQRADPLAAFPDRSIRAWRAEPFAARVAILPSLAFFGLAALSMVVAAQFNPAVERDQKVVDDTALRQFGRVALFVVRFGAAWAALVASRVAGLLVRDVPAIREILS